MFLIHEFGFNLYNYMIRTVMQSIYSLKEI